jgi:hypothetical protein
MVPDTLAELSPWPAQALPSVEGTWRLTTALPAKDPEARPVLTFVGLMPPCGQAVACHLIMAESGAFFGDDEEHVNGLEANAPLSWAEYKVSMFPEFVVQPDSVADTCEVCVPPPDLRSGGENWIVPESEQVTEAWMLCAADAAWDVNTSMPTTIIDETSHRTARLPGAVVALLRRFSMSYPARMVIRSLARKRTPSILLAH